MIPKTLSDLIETLEELETSRDKFSFLIELGEELPLIEEKKKNDASKLKGCASNAWIDIQNRDKKWYITGDADAQISKGMLGFLSLALSGLTSKEIQNIPKSILEENEIFTTLSPSRSNGASNAIQLIRKKTSLSQNN